jgi:hypothetical protein
VALVRVSGRSLGQPLNFALEPPATGTQVAVVQYPYGRADPAVSIGRVLETEDSAWIGYTADTAPGSSGAPVLDAGWNVVAMHYRSGAEQNEGVSRAFLVDLLRQSRFWPQLAQEQGFADISQSDEPADHAAAKRKGPSPLHRRAALSPLLNPKSLTAAQREDLKGLIPNPDLPSWVLPVSERRAIIDAAGSLDALRRHRRRSRHPAEKVIDSIFEGPPYTYETGDEEELGWWIQVVRWFEGIIPDLPSPADLTTRLERRRLRSRFERVAGPDFQGRRGDINKLKAWYEKGGPLMVTGVGGIGKSALLATFSLSLPEDTLLLWLDFDRADLAPDDAGSVLSSLADQIRLQREDTAALPAVDGDDWASAARQLGARIAAAGGGDPILVLDSFEAAQYSDRYQELWPVLEALTAAAPRLRVCVTGRAEVAGLALNKRAATALPLKGLSDEAATRWLGKHDIVAPDILKPVLRIAQGIPLILRLALRYLETGGRMEDLPKDLPVKVIAGYLYRRILNRVHDPALHSLAARVLILRRFSEGMLQQVFEGIVEFPPGEPADWVTELRREKSLLDGSGELRLRSEVRAATLALLERETPEIVREVDRRAADWYAALPQPTVEDSAELVYHRLRLGDLPGAAAAWREGCGAFLTYAPDELRDEAARMWLNDQLHGGGQSIEEWEYSARQRIADARSRGNQRAVLGILGERTQRSSLSPLAFEEGYELWRMGQGPAAESVLERRNAAPPQDPSCTALLALLVQRREDSPRAEALLGTLDRAIWSHRPDTDWCDLAVQAARIRLTFDLRVERAFLDHRERHHFSPNEYRGVLAPMDVNLPLLLEFLDTDTWALESLSRDFDPAKSDPWQVLSIFDENHGNEPEQRQSGRRLRAESWSTGRSEDVPVANPASLVSTSPPDLALYLADLSWRRWWLTASHAFLQRASALHFDFNRNRSRQDDGVLATMMLLVAKLTGRNTSLGGVPFEHVVRESPWYRQQYEVDPQTQLQLWTFLRSNSSDPFDVPGPLIQGAAVITIDELVSRFSPRSRQVETACLAHFILAGDPLEALIHSLANPVSEKMNYPS